MLCASGKPERTDSALILTLSLERADGIERVAFRCAIANALLSPDESASIDVVVERLAPWVAREFEKIREEALKAVRTERRLFRVEFDLEQPGPFLR
jgi:hypothetical protein